MATDSSQSTAEEQKVDRGARRRLFAVTATAVLMVLAAFIFKALNPSREQILANRRSALAKHFAGPPTQGLTFEYVYVTSSSPGIKRNLDDRSLSIHEPPVFWKLTRGLQLAGKGHAGSIARDLKELEPGFDFEEWTSGVLKTDNAGHTLLVFGPLKTDPRAFRLEMDLWFHNESEGKGPGLSVKYVCDQKEDNSGKISRSVPSNVLNIRPDIVAGTSYGLLTMAADHGASLLVITTRPSP